MNLKINGKEVSAAAGITVEGLLDKRPGRGRVVVALNRTVLPDTLWEKTALKEGDALEIFTLFGGG
ncbi:MAG: sulfur carrier protein ThiS [Elusimicrobia bacterium]|nr:sulfur carrier protein ThiS [Elusimicrobiota bacterium]